MTGTELWESYIKNKTASVVDIKKVVNRILTKLKPLL
jgi:hypothetical protein